MTTYRKNSLLSDVLGAGPIPQRTLVYFRARLTNRIHQLILEEFSKREQGKTITRAELGRRIGRDAAQITRWLGSPSNCTTETLSDLLLGMKCEPALSINSLEAASVADTSNSTQSQIATISEAQAGGNAAQESGGLGFLRPAEKPSAYLLPTNSSRNKERQAA